VREQIIRMVGEQRLRVGLAGLGRFGKLHAAVLGTLPGVNLAALCDPRPEEVAAACTRHPDAAGFADFETMLAAAHLDAVFIVTPEPLHVAQISSALARRIPVFVEKPLALTSIEGERVAAAATVAGVPLQVGFVLRFESQHAALQSQIARGALGNLVSLRAKRNVSRAWFPDYGDRAHPIYETAIHDIDLLLWYAASPVTRVQALQSNRSGMRYPDGCWALLEFASGAVGLIETSWFVPDGAPANVITPTWHGTIDAEIEAIGEAATGRIRLLDAALSLWNARITEMPDTGMWPELGGTVGGALREEDAHFLERVRSGTPETIASVADAVAGLRIAEAIVVSADSGSPVALDAVRQC
jgi:predicted dehydrogenase